MKRRIIVAGLSLGLLATAALSGGCGSDETTETTAAETPTTTMAAQEAPTSTAGAAEAPTTSIAVQEATIALPEGWTMDQAVSAEGVSAITGESMEYFPEANSAAQSGRPSAGYLIPGTDGSKVYFYANVAGGEEEFESFKEYAQEGSVIDVSGVGDKAYLAVFSDTQEGIIALKGETVIRIDWNPTVYEVDPGQFGTELANLLLGNIFE